MHSDFEQAVLAETGAVAVDDVDVEHRSLAYAPRGADTLALRAGPGGARVVLLGGAAFGERIVMWWNSVGRSHEEIVEFRRRCQAEVGYESAAPAPAGRPPLSGPFPADRRRCPPRPCRPRGSGRVGGRETPKNSNRQEDGHDR